ncbi:IQ calmodulin-binding domain containing protein igloo [Andrena cerasifolii]|uniref:IQ calmodulin-binding domain containing protein igloo n=1 Tax=Andrena cerasifolii TaxID=2819439 RepID=UPI004037AB52
MGCNTSKESVQPVGDEAKEDVKNGDVRKASEANSAKTESKESSQEKTEGVKESETKGSIGSVDSKVEEEEEDKVGGKERDDAATRIQAAFRGHHARKCMKETEPSTKQTGTKSNSEPTEEQLQQEFSADDMELCKAAATKIEVTTRSHMSRAEQAVTMAAKSAESAIENVATDMEDKAKDAMNELEGIDLTDPDLHKAATKIQASFRGHKVRQEVMSTPGSEEPKK